MNKSLQQLIEEYAHCPLSQRIYENDGKNYAVTRHFTGDKNLNEVAVRLALSRANREMGL